jgi:hypothetical protein
MYGSGWLDQYIEAGLRCPVPKSKKGRLHPAVTEWIKKLASQGGRARAAGMTPEERQEVAREGGRARARNMTPEQRRERASKAARARWGKKKSANKKP